MDALNPFGNKKATKRQKNLRENMGIVGLLMFVIVIIAAIVVLQPSATNVSTNCLVTETPPASLAIIIDGTDPFTIVQSERLHQELKDLLFETATLPQYSKVSIYLATTSSSRLIEPKFVRCIPEIDSSIVAGNPELTRALWRNNFQAPVDSVLSEIIESDRTSSQSPILEAIQQVTLIERRTKVTQSRTLVVISDFLQNSSDISHYRSVLPDPDLLGNVATRHLHTDMAGWNVIMFYVVRRDPVSSTIQDRSHQNHWMEIFRFFGASNEHIKMSTITG